MKYLSLLFSVFCIFFAQSAQGALPDGWHVQVWDYSQPISPEPTASSDRTAGKFVPFVYYFKGSFELPAVGYTCNIIKDGEVILKVACQNKSEDGISFDAPAPRILGPNDCSSKKKKEKVDDTAFSSASISKNGTTLYSLRIGGGSNYPCVFVLDPMMLDPKSSPAP